MRTEWRQDTAIRIVVDPDSNRASEFAGQIELRGGRSASSLASLLQEWRSSEAAAFRRSRYRRVSGGADSVALLLALDELIKANKLNIRHRVAHLDHRLRKESADDARWVKDLATRLGHEVSNKPGRCEESLPRRSGDNLEQAARRARYRWFAEVGAKARRRSRLDGTHDGRSGGNGAVESAAGSGTDGMSGIEPVRLLNQRHETDPGAAVACHGRSREDTEGFCRARGIEFRQDEMNEDESIRPSPRAAPAVANDGDF